MHACFTVNDTTTANALRACYTVSRKSVGLWYYGFANIPTYLETDVADTSPPIPCSDDPTLKLDSQSDTIIILSFS
jgi:hypothetical protein